jgi:redox-sensitive bicupin YhaK (pirin superfamily)
MTSGRGILHEEMPRRGPDGKIHGFQLWVNLPAKLKMTQPRYQEVKEGSIPTIKINGASIRVVAGNAFGQTGPVTDIAASPTYMDVRLDPDSTFSLPIPNNHTTLAYVSMVKLYSQVTLKRKVPLDRFEWCDWGTEMRSGKDRKSPGSFHALQQ